MINKYKKQKVGGGRKYGYYGHPTAIVGERKLRTSDIHRFLRKVGVAGLVAVNALSLAVAFMPVAPAPAVKK